jgi:trehalose/maltose transport system permease protein
MKRPPASLNRAARAEQRAAYLLVAPALLVVLLVAIYPLGSGLVKSFTDELFASDRVPAFVGLRNYSSLLGLTFRTTKPLADPATGTVLTDPRTGAPTFPSPEEVLPRRPVRYSLIGEFSFLGIHVVVGARNPAFIQAILNTLAFTLITITFEATLGVLLALLLQRKFRGRGALRAIMLVPWAIPTVISSRMWAWMFTSTRAGFFNVILQYAGVGNGQIPFLEARGWQLPIMCIIDIWKTTPFMALLILAGLQLIPLELYEAAEVDGVTRSRRFWRITLPLLRQTLAVALVFRTLDALRVFDLFQIVLGESRYSMASFTYYQLIQNRAAGYSAASGVVIFLLIFAFAILYTRILGFQAAEHQE